MLGEQDPKVLSEQKGPKLTIVTHLKKLSPTKAVYLSDDICPAVRLG